MKVRSETHVKPYGTIGKPPSSTNSLSAQTIDKINKQRQQEAAKKKLELVDKAFGSGPALGSLWTKKAQ